ncbi:MAG: hypothetical protein HDT32_05030 [Clostridiales bacterium]|nr:hypothetical protein [Clostridiales bacterium]
MSKNDALVRFNIKNAKWALKLEDGKYEVPKSYGKISRKIAIEADSNTKKIFGDGECQAYIINDKGKSVVLTTNTLNNEFEQDMGRKMETAKGIASIKQQKVPTFALYFETEGVMPDGRMGILAKSWLYGMKSPTAPSESFEQTTDDINETVYETSFEASGEILKDADGKEYKDEKTKCPVRVWLLTSTPDMPDFDTFGDTVVMPTMRDTKAETTTPNTAEGE